MQAVEQQEEKDVATGEDINGHNTSMVAVCFSETFHISTISNLHEDDKKFIFHMSRETDALDNTDTL